MEPHNTHTIWGWVNHHWLMISMVYFPAFMGYLNSFVVFLKVMGYTKLADFLGKFENATKAAVDNYKIQKQQTTETPTKGHNMNFWESIKSFFANLGHSIMADIVSALPEAQQLLLEAFTALINAAIAYVAAKYGETQPEALKAMSAQDKLTLDNQRHNEAFDYIKSKASETPGAYPAINDSLLHAGIEIYYQKYLRAKEGNQGNFPGGNSNA